MSFTPPSFPSLRVDSLNLDSNFSTLLGRYKIITVPDPSSTSSSAEVSIKQSPLEVLIARTHNVVTCATDRSTAKAVFNQLSNEMRDVLKEKNEANINEGAKLLLGALLHRYFRLMKEYDASNSYTSYFWTPFDVKNCKLFIAIRKALNLPDEMPADYRKRDLNALDPTTVVSCLTVFRDKMKLKDRYLTYPHFLEDKNFHTHLDEIIEEHTTRGSSVINQFKSINFIQSLVKQIEVDQRHIEEALVSWCTKLAKDHSEFNQLSIQVIEEHLQKTLESGPIREKIADLLYTPAIKDNLLTMKHPDFLSEMKKCSMEIASYTIVGGYSLLLQSKSIQEQLRFCMHQALGIHKNPTEMTDNDMLYGINFLQQYIKNNPLAVLDYDFFGGKDKLDTQLSKTELALTKKIQEQRADSTSLVV